MEEKKAVRANRLPPAIYAELEAVVGKDYISQDRAVIETYSRFGIDIIGYLKKHAKDPSNIPACIILPGTTEEIQAVVRMPTNIKFLFLNDQRPARHRLYAYNACPDCLYPLQQNESRLSK